MEAKRSVTRGSSCRLGSIMIVCSAKRKGVGVGVQISKMNESTWSSEILKHQTWSCSLRIMSRDHFFVLSIPPFHQDSTL